MNNHTKNFLRVLVAALMSSVLGGLFASLLYWMSPDFIGNMFPDTRSAFAMGMILGLFIGAFTMICSLFIAALANNRKKE